MNGDTRRIERVASGRVENLRRLGERGCGGVEVAFEEQHMRKRVESDGQHRERTELTRRLDVENRELADGLEIPQQHRRAELLTEPVSDLGEDRVIDRRLQRPSQRRRGDGRPVDGELGVADEEPLLGRVEGRPRTRQRGLGRLTEADAAVDDAGRRHRLDVRDSGEVEIERLEALGGTQPQIRSVACVAADHRVSSAEHIELGSAHVVER